MRSSLIEKGCGVRGHHSAPLREPASPAAGGDRGGRAGAASQQPLHGALPGAAAGGDRRPARRAPASPPPELWLGSDPAAALRSPRTTGVHLLTPTYSLFPEIAGSYSETRLLPEDDFRFDLAELSVPERTSLVAIVNPNNPNGAALDTAPLAGLLRRHPDVWFLVDEAFIDLGHASVARLVPHHDNLVVTRTFSKAHSLAGFRVGYAVAPEQLADELNASNDAYPLAPTEPGCRPCDARAPGRARVPHRRAQGVDRGSRRRPRGTRRAHVPD
jgi:Aminotransferase class I and II